VATSAESCSFIRSGLKQALLPMPATPMARCWNSARHPRYLGALVIGVEDLEAAVASNVTGLDGEIARRSREDAMKWSGSAMARLPTWC